MAVMIDRSQDVRGLRVCVITEMFELEPSGRRSRKRWMDLPEEVLHRAVNSRQLENDNVVTPEDGGAGISVPVASLVTSCPVA